VTQDDSPLDLGERIRRIAAAIAGEVDKRWASSDELLPILDSVARSLGSTIERWAGNPSLRRLLGGVERDVVTGPGERVDLFASLGVAARLGSHARFSVDGVAVAEVPIPESGEVRALFDAPAPGLHQVRVDLCNKAGAVVSGASGHRLLQVADGRPVVLVRAGLFLPRASEDPVAKGSPGEALRALVDAGFELVYFDVHEKNRDAQIQAALRAKRRPPAAILVQSAEEQDLRSLGVDFVDMFVTTVIRRLRARGVPVTTILGARDEDSGASRAEQVRVMSPATVLARARGDGFDAERAQAAQLLRERAQADPLDWRLDQTTRSRLVPGNSFHAELDNAQARRRLFDAIEAAAATVHLQFYMVEPGDFSERLVVALIRRARAGVKVRFMVDALYSDEEVLGRLNPLIQSLRAESGIEVLALSPIESHRHMDVTRLKRRDHRKLVVVDGRLAFVTGRNASDAYFFGFDEVPVHDNTRHERIPWLDAHVEVSGPLVRDVQESFLSTWHKHGGARVPVDAGVLPELARCGDAAGRLVVHHGLDDTNGLAMYESLFDTARSHVYIVNDFPIVPALERAILRLLARGVRVEILTGNAAARRDDGSFFPAPMHRTLFEYMVKAKLEPLLVAGAAVYEYVPPHSPTVVARGGRIRPYVHAKVVSVDGLATSIGSANLDATASFWESEANVVVEDAAFASGVEATLRKMIDNSFRLDPELDYWKRERTQRAVVGTLWPDTLYS
jgi:phosphatidylserine/phosphatidylglycerophosphate/cardiolipin synthase-like enzyme